VADTPQTFCASLISLRRYVHTQYGRGSFQRLAERMRRDHDIELPLALASRTWYPTTWFLAGMDAARDLFGPDDFYERFGSTAAEYEIPILFRWALRLTDPRGMLERASREWHKAHDTGRWCIESGDPRRMRGTLFGFGVVHEGQCRALTAWITRACRMTGAPKVRVWHPHCRAHGDSDCAFEGEW
jgi:hypothetical protein